MMLADCKACRTDTHACNILHCASEYAFWFLCHYLGVTVVTEYVHDIISQNSYRSFFMFEFPGVALSQVAD
jgi:hypothetical protein